MVVILGGGISGLCAAFYALQKVPGKSIRLIEASHRLGGWIQTTRTAEGFIFEHGPRTIRPVGEKGINTLNLIEDLGLSEKVRPILRTHPAAKVRLIYAKGALHPLPTSFGAMFRTQPPFSKPLVAVLMKDLLSSPKFCPDDNAYDFVVRRLGEDVAKYAIAPLLCGVCAGDAREISVKMLFRPLFEAEQKHHSIVKGMLKNIIKNAKQPKQKIDSSGALVERYRQEKWSVYGLAGGLETLVEAMVEKLSSSGVQIYLKERCNTVRFSDKGVEVTTVSGLKLQDTHLISSLPGNVLGSLVGQDLEDVSSILRKEKRVTVGVVNLRYQGNVLKTPAFGFLVPPVEKLPILGVIYDSVCFPNAQNDTVLTVMMGGHWFHPTFTNASQQVFAQTAKHYVSKILKITEEPVDQNVKIQVDCIPQYTVGHFEKLDRIFELIRGKKLPLFLAGSSYQGIGINDVIVSAKDAVYLMFSEK